MKKIFGFLTIVMFMACNNGSGTSDRKQDTSASSSADSTLRAVEKMKADSSVNQTDTTSTKDSIKK
jgi:hypothetical protein